MVVAVAVVVVVVRREVTWREASRQMRQMSGWVPKTTKTAAGTGAFRSGRIHQQRCGHLQVA